MKALIAWLIAATTLVSIQSDIDYYLDAAQPANLSGTSDLQIVVEQSLERFDGLTVADCFRTWWALERSALFLMGESLRLSVVRNKDGAQLTGDAMHVLRFYGEQEGTTCVN